MKTFEINNLYVVIIHLVDINSLIEEMYDLCLRILILLNSK